MKRKESLSANLLALYHEGLAFEQTVKTVEITVRGKIQIYNIRPMDFDTQAAYSARLNRINTGKGLGNMKVTSKMMEDYQRNGEIDFNLDDLNLDQENQDQERTIAMLDVVISNTIEFSEINEEHLDEIGASDIYEVVKRILGRSGMFDLFMKINNFSHEEEESKGDRIIEEAQNLKNDYTESD